MVVVVVVVVVDCLDILYALCLPVVVIWFLFDSKQEDEVRVSFIRLQIRATPSNPKPKGQGVLLARAGAMMMMTF